MQLVNYDQPRLLTVGLTTSNTHALKDVTFVPGVNEISDADWEACLKNSLLAGMVKEGHLEVVKSVKGENSLKGMNEEQAMAMIRKTYAVEPLKKWLHLETRQRLTREIAAKLKTLVQEDRLERLGLGELKSEPTETVQASADVDADAAFNEQFPRVDDSGKKVKPEVIKAPKKKK